MNLLSLKGLGIVVGVGALIGITIFSINIISAQLPEKFYPVWQIGDEDGDDVPDDRDFLPNGNGGVRVTITRFDGKDNCKNVFPLFNPKCQPKFWIVIDINGDGRFDDKEGKAEKAYSNENSIENPLSHEANIPDHFTRVNFIVRVKDMDGNNWIDYWPHDKHSYGYFEFNLREGVKTWKYAGDSEVRCEIQIKAEIIEWTRFP